MQITFVFLARKFDVLYEISFFFWMLEVVKIGVFKV
jgi:hypothetical protein